MVVHSPSKLDLLRQTAAERRAADEVPPSVRAAALDAAAGDAAVTPAAVDQLADGVVDGADQLVDGAAPGLELGGAVGGANVADEEDVLTQDFAEWNGNHPPGTGPGSATGGENVNVTVRKGKVVNTDRQEAAGATAKDEQGGANPRTRSRMLRVEPSVAHLRRRLQGPGTFPRSIPSLRSGSSGSSVLQSQLLRPQLLPPLGLLLWPLLLPLLVA